MRLFSFKGDKEHERESAGLFYLKGDREHRRGSVCGPRMIELLYIFCQMRTKVKSVELHITDKNEKWVELRKIEGVCVQTSLDKQK